MNDSLNALNLVIKLWPIFGSIIVVIAWFIRLESRQFFMEKDFLRFQEESKENNNEIWKNIDKIKELQLETLKTLSRIEGKLDKK